jgi:hypothetical protein
MALEESDALVRASSYFLKHETTHPAPVVRFISIWCISTEDKEFSNCLQRAFVCVEINLPVVKFCEIFIMVVRFTLQPLVIIFPEDIGRTSTFFVRTRVICFGSRVATIPSAPERSFDDQASIRHGLKRCIWVDESYITVNDCANSARKMLTCLDLTLHGCPDHDGAWQSGGGEILDQCFQSR